MARMFNTNNLETFLRAGEGLDRRNRENEESKIRMMQLDSQLQNEAMERELLPKRLEMEDARLKFEMKEKQHRMGMEVTQMADNLLTNRLSRSIATSSEGRARDMHRIDLGTKIWNYLYLPHMLNEKLGSARMMNIVKPIQILTMALSSVAPFLKEAISGQAASDKAYTEHLGRFLDGIVTDTDGVKSFSNQFLSQLYGHEKTRGQFSKDGTEESFARSYMQEFLYGMSGRYVDDKGKFIAPTQGQFEKDWKEYSRKFVARNIIDLAVDNPNINSAVFSYSSNFKTAQQQISSGVDKLTDKEIESAGFTNAEDLKRYIMDTVYSGRGVDDLKERFPAGSTMRINIGVLDTSAKAILSRAAVDGQKVKFVPSERSKEDLDTSLDSLTARLTRGTMDHQAAVGAMRAYRDSATMGGFIGNLSTTVDNMMRVSAGASLINTPFSSGGSISDMIMDIYGDETEQFLDSSGAVSEDLIMDAGARGIFNSFGLGDEFDQYFQNAPTPSSGRTSARQ